MDSESLFPHSSMKKRLDETSSQSRSSNEDNPKDNCASIDPEIVGYHETTPTLAKQSPRKIALKLILFILIGFVFGWALHKGLVYEPIAVRYQFVFLSFDMLKMFLSAAAVSQFIFVILSLRNRPLLDIVREEFCSACQGKGVVGTAVGAFVLGAGMALGGGCPGMVLAQVGGGVPNSYITLIGCLVGALLYGIMEVPLRPMVSKGAISQEKSTLDGIMKKINTSLLLGLFCMFLVAVVVIIEVVWPWYKDLEILVPGFSPNTTSPWGKFGFDALSWPAYLSGALIGLLQIPVVFLVSDSLGSATSYMTLVSQWVRLLPLNLREKHFPSMSRLSSNNAVAAIWWQVFYVCGAILGALTSATLNGTFGILGAGVYPLEAFFGGVLMVFGSRMAAGCTSGHGLSGMALLSTLSLVAVPAMFAGGIVTAFSMQAAGNLVPTVQ